MEAQLGIRGVLLETMLGPALHIETKVPAIRSKQTVLGAELSVISQVPRIGELNKSATARLIHNDP